VFDGVFEEELEISMQIPFKFGKFSIKVSKFSHLGSLLGFTERDKQKEIFKNWTCEPYSQGEVIQSLLRHKTSFP
jgi:hypothetical protein